MVSVRMLLIPALTSHSTCDLEAGYPDPASLPFCTQTKPEGSAATFALSLLKKSPPVPKTGHDRTAYVLEPSSNC